MTIQNILVAIDFSPAAAAAIEAASDLAKRLSAKLHLLHTCSSTTAAAELSSDARVDRAGTHTRVDLTEVTSRLSEQGVSCSTHVCSAAPVGAILDLAGQLPADLIALGTRGLSDLAKALLGSVAERTLRQAPCPVMTVRASATRSPGAGPLLVPLDFSANSQLAVDWAVDFRNSLGNKPQLILAHAYGRMRLVARQRYAHLLDALAERSLGELTRRAERLRAAGVPCEVASLSGEPHEVIARIANDRGCSAVVMASAYRAIVHPEFGSVVQHVVRIADCPVFALHE